MITVLEVIGLTVLFLAIVYPAGFFGAQLLEKWTRVGKRIAKLSAKGNHGTQHHRRCVPRQTAHVE